MTPLAVGMMIGVCGLVWGGFLLLLTRAMRHEGLKAGGGEAARKE